jgi:peroxiredoxin/outer membrane lipoprotein-sorting protein
MKMPTTAWFSRPNKLYYETSARMQSTKMISDGESLYSVIDMFSGVVKMPAPDDFSGLPMAQFGGMGGQQFVGARVPDVVSLVTGAFDAENLTKVEYGIDESNEWLSSLEQPDGTWTLTIGVKGGSTVALWIDKRDRTVRKFATEMDFGGMMESLAEERQEALEELPKQMRGMFEDMQMRIEVEVDTAELDVPPSDGTYAYTPEEGTEVIEAEDFEEGMRALLEDQMGGLGDIRGETDRSSEQPPDFSAQTPGGDPVDLGSFKGKPLMLHFWVSWNSESVEQMSVLSELHRQYADQGLQIVAISTDPSVDEVESFMEENEIDFTVLWLPPEDARAAIRDHDLGPVPQTLYIDPEWMVQAHADGPQSKAEMLEALGKIGIETAG